MVLQAWASLGPQVTAARMVRDYTTALYEPAAASSIHLSANGAKPAVELAAWRKRVDGIVGRRRRSRPSTSTTRRRTAGATRGVVVTATLGGLTPADVRVEVVHGLARPRRRVPQRRQRSPSCSPPGPTATPARSRSASPAPTASRRGSSRCTPTSPAASTSAASPGLSKCASLARRLARSAVSRGSESACGARPPLDLTIHARCGRGPKRSLPRRARVSARVVARPVHACSPRTPRVRTPSPRRLRPAETAGGRPRGSR